MVAPFRLLRNGALAESCRVCAQPLARGTVATVPAGLPHRLLLANGKAHLALASGTLELVDELVTNHVEPPQLACPGPGFAV